MLEELPEQEQEQDNISIDGLQDYGTKEDLLVLHGFSFCTLRRWPLHVSHTWVCTSVF